jgi:hypothetical protein
MLQRSSLTSMVSLRIFLNKFMPLIKKKAIKTKKSTSLGSSKAIVSTSVKDYSNEPFFIKKADSAKKLIDKYGLPKQLLK